MPGAQIRPEPIVRWDCEHCGNLCERPPTKGQRPKWCSVSCRDMARKGRQATCTQCGAEFFGHGVNFCSRSCSASYGNALRGKSNRTPKPRVDPESRRRSMCSPIRLAVEDFDLIALTESLRANSISTDVGCWIWQGRLRDGYPALTIAGTPLHRAIVETANGGPLGSQAAHHVCANRACVQPAHLVPVTHAENIAEMLARSAYLSRIRELESALESLAPRHPLLSVVAVA